MKKIVYATLLTLLPTMGALAAAPKAVEPTNGMIKVAFVISSNANVMDIAGSWEVFQDTSLPDSKGKEVAPYEIYTVAPSKQPLHTTGSNHPGLTITPDYSFEDAPMPDIVIVGAQRGGDGMSQWLQKIHAQNKTVVSVCTGAFKLAEAGLLDGKPATTHHWYFGDMQTQHPAVKLVREVRYVQSDPTTYTAGGLTSGVDLSLHLVAERFGQDVAQQTADYMEYQGTGWKTNQGISQLTTPIKREDWSGTLGSGAKVIVHLVTEGASTSATADIPAQQVKGVTTRLGGGNGKSSIAFNIAGHPATFEGKGNADGSQLDGIFQQDGKETPLVLTRDR